ncbi:hypothetical protein TRAPUB_10088 [Trametes pubescens]|uniref:Uncharacterized protein n=1 Tax=Trametes pubescens TaxID=154538 RepID=A0A1M2W0M7_TRAPU|nr:hypothetical protein TRAPUB_10088 [Trametes pubescens]
MGIVGCRLNREQKRISRNIAPHVQDALLQVYRDALLGTGKGSVTRQQQYVHDAINEKRGNLFEDTANTLKKRLDVAANELAQSIRPALQKIAQRAEINLAVLYEKVFDNDEDGEIRERLLALLDTVQSNLDALKRARELRGPTPRADPARLNNDDDDEDTDEDSAEDDIASGDGDADDQDITRDGDSEEQAECEAGPHAGSSVEDAEVDEETGGGLSSELDHVADAQDKPAANSDTDVIMDVVPAHPGDKGPSDAIKVEVKMEDIVEDGRESDDSIGKDA